jgi:hypothetical protein
MINCAGFEILEKIIDLAEKMSRPTKVPDEYVLEEKYLSFIKKFMETIDPSFHVPSNTPLAMILKYVSLLKQKYAARQTPIRIIHFLHTFSGYDLEDGYSYDDDIRNKNVTHVDGVLAVFRKTNPEVSKIVDDLMNCVQKMNTMEDEVQTLKEKIFSDVIYLQIVEQKLITAEERLQSYTRKGVTKQYLYSFNKEFNVYPKYMKKRNPDIIEFLKEKVKLNRKDFTIEMQVFNTNTNKRINRLETIPGLLSKEIKNFEDSKTVLLKYLGLYNDEDVIV